ncbi:bacillithiol transferase BstA [Pontibacter sp. FD36]|uniref:YfiT family bacillithiol transferase n=1 Tax=Pontibacter sp. FD36 TaxID=2789860 RepID=UPI0018ABAF1C|nr:bacillithiol transferase BstA [Pontibacter sp. FD36]MBF8964247.1 bacillithiol transferase BstA [Pontibacter sp. FD36]
MDKLRYPIGQFDLDASISEDQLNLYILSIGSLPTKLAQAVANLSDEQLDTPYRPGGWTVRQVVHHLPDSHLNGYTRQKLALTEENPIIRPYDEVAWAELPEAKTADPGISLTLLHALHQRWVLMLHQLSREQLNRTFVHPVSGQQTIRQHIGLYAWHGEHHLAHITELKKRMDW